MILVKYYINKLSVICRQVFIFCGDRARTATYERVWLFMLNCKALKNADMRENSVASLSIPQLRSMLFLKRNPGASLSELADLLESLTTEEIVHIEEGLTLLKHVFKRSKVKKAP
jgi:hypothetical protein